jgi:leucyl aminopeptidase
MISAPDVRLTSVTLPNLDADVLVVAAWEDPAGLDVPGVTESVAREIGRARTQGELKGKPDEVLLLPTGVEHCPRLMLIGAGLRKDWSRDRLRRLASVGALAARQRGMRRVALAMPAGNEEVRSGVQAAVEGLLFAAFDGDTYKTSPREAAGLAELQVVVPAGLGGTGQALERGRIVGESVNLARALVNEPSNLLTPSRLADRAADAAAGAAIEVEVLDQDRITALGMGLLLGVARGSAEPPRLVSFRWQPPEPAPGGPVLGLVGKGVTFDTGGISIKAAEGMDRMKADMSGAAAVIAAMCAFGQLRPPVPVVGVIPLTENMPGGRAMKPGDVLTGASGKTVEVNNTDAEGRLILGDALWYAQQLGATHLVDVATLTGSCAVALGLITSGLMGAPDWFVEQVREAAARAGDRVWPLPLFDEYAEQIRSDIADVLNTGGRWGGAITAAMFLKEFSGGRPWAHLDIAGTAWADEPKPFQPKGPTGVGVRTLIELAFSAAGWQASPTAQKARD